MGMVWSDRSFRQNLAGLVIAALLAALLNLLVVAPQAHVHVMDRQEMALVQGQGWVGNGLIGVGILIAVVGVAAVLTGGVVIVAIAAAGTTYGAAAAATAINVGLYAMGGGAGLATVGGAVNFVESQRY